MFYQAPSGNIYAIEKIASIRQGSKTDNYQNAKDRIIIETDRDKYVENFESEEERDTVIRDIWEAIKNSKQ